MPIQLPIRGRKVGDPITPGARARPVDVTAGARVASTAAGAVASGVSAAGAEFQRVTKEQNQSAVRAANVELIEARQELQDDPENGLVTKKGANAIKESASFKSFLEAKAERIRDNLANDDQRAQFAKTWDSERVAFDSSVDRHVARESAALANTTHKAQVATAVNDAAAHAARSDYGLALRSVGIAQGANDQRAQEMGWSPEVAEQVERTTFTTGVLSILDGMVKNSDLGLARKWLETHRPNLDVEMVERSKIDERLAAGANRGRARFLSETAWTMNKGDPDAAIEWLREQDIADPAVEKDAMDQVERRSRQGQLFVKQRDDQSVGLLRQELYDRTQPVPTRDHDEYVKLTEERKGLWDREVDAELNRREARGRQRRTLQLQLDDLFLKEMKSLDQTGSPGNDQESVNVRDRWPEAGQGMWFVMDAVQNKAKRDTLKGRATNTQETKSIVLEALDAADIRDKSKEGKGIIRFVNNRVTEWEDPQNPGIRPPRKTVSEWVAAWFQKTEREKSAWYQNDDIMRIKAEMAGIPVKDPVTGEALKPVAPTGPPRVPDGRVGVRLVDGTEHSVPAHQLDEFLREVQGSSRIE